MTCRKSFVAIFIAATAAGTVSRACFAQAAGYDAGPAPVAQDASSTQPVFSQQQIAQLVAPLALYPDSLLTQILMASTYPLEVVQADRFVKAHADLKGEDLAHALDGQQWDPSVKSLTNFPQVLERLSDQLDNTVQLGNAFLAQQQDVMASVQDLRSRAQAAGTLRSDDKYKVESQPYAQADAPPDAGPPVSSAPAIVIDNAQQDLTYVPSYDSNVVYGAWPYPDYAPDVYQPYGYTSGVALWYGPPIYYTPAWGYAWGRFDWHHRWVEEDPHRHERWNHDIDRDHYHFFVPPDHHDDRGPLPAPGRVGPVRWFHDPAHRAGVPYVSRDVAVHYGVEQREDQAERARAAYRGRADYNQPNQDHRDNAGRATTYYPQHPAEAPNERTIRRGDSQPQPVTVDHGNARADARKDEENNRNKAAHEPQPIHQDHADVHGGEGPFNDADRTRAEERAASARGQQSREATPANVTVDAPPARHVEAPAPAASPRVVDAPRQQAPRAVEPTHVAEPAHVSEPARVAEPAHVSEPAHVDAPAHAAPTPGDAGNHGGGENRR